MKWFSTKIGFRIFAIILFGLFFTDCYAQADVKFIATSNEKEIGRNDIVQVTFRVENASSIDKITPPDFEDFDIVRGPSQQSNITIQNGKRTSSYSISYILRPKKTGTFTIPGATVQVDGKKLTSNKLQIKVLSQPNLHPQNAPANPPGNTPFGVPPNSNPGDNYYLKPGEDIAKKIKENLLLKLESNKTSCFVGEPVVVSYTLYTRLLSKSTITEAPSFNGFSVSEMDVANQPEAVKINGKEFSKYTLRKVQLFPLRPGEYTITPIESVNHVSFTDKKSLDNPDMDPILKMMQDMGVVDLSPNSIQKTIQLKSNPLKIQVKPLPKEGQPSDFSGAVGSFTIQTILTKDSLTTDDVGELSVTISGEGNFNLITRPDIDFQQGLIPLDAKSKDQIDINSVPLKGEKTFTIPFSITDTGIFQIPPIRFSWFDPASDEYKTAVSEPITFRVHKGEKVQESQVEKQNSFALPGILLGVLAVLIALVSILIFRKRNAKSQETTEAVTPDTKETAAPQTVFNKQEELLAIKEKISDIGYSGSENGYRDIYKMIESSLYRFFSHALNISVSDLSYQSIVDELHIQQVNTETIEEVKHLFKQLEQKLYTGNISNEPPDELLGSLSTLIEEVEVQL